MLLLIVSINHNFISIVHITKIGIAVDDRKVTDCIAKVTLVVSLNSRSDDGVSVGTCACVFMRMTLLFFAIGNLQVGRDLILIS